MLFATEGGIQVPGRKSRCCLDREQPQNTIVQKFDLPCIRAVLAIGEGNSAQAIRLLQSTRYDLAEGDLALSPIAWVRGFGDSYSAARYYSPYNEAAGRSAWAMFMGFAVPREKLHYMSVVPIP